MDVSTLKRGDKVTVFPGTKWQRVVEVISVDNDSGHMSVLVRDEDGASTVHEANIGPAPIVEDMMADEPLLV